MLKKHHSQLDNSSNELKSFTSLLADSKPILTNLSTDSVEIMEIAIKFLKVSKECFYIGSLESVKLLKKKKDKKQNELTLKKLEYVNQTTEFIHDAEKLKYVRIMNFIPNISNNYTDILRSNIEYFLSQYKTSPNTENILQLYHNSQIQTISGDFHFRCSDAQVIIRSGGHKNEQANSALVITDNRVITEYMRYMQSLIDDPNCKQIGEKNLEAILKFIDNDDSKGIEKYLNLL